MKSLQLASLTVALSFAAFAVNAQMPDQPSSSPGNGSQDTQQQQLQLPQHQLQLPQLQLPGSDQPANEPSAPSVPQQQQTATADGSGHGEREQGGPDEPEQPQIDAAGFHSWRPAGNRLGTRRLAGGASHMSRSRRPRRPGGSTPLDSTANRRAGDGTSLPLCTSDTSA